MNPKTIPSNDVLPQAAKPTAAAPEQARGSGTPLASRMTRLLAVLRGRNVSRISSLDEQPPVEWALRLML